MKSTSNDPNRGFWSEARRFFSKCSVSSAPVVDGVSGVDDIARLWGDRFKELYNTADDSISSELLLSLDSSTTLADIEQISVSFQTVQEAIGKLKRGKSDGGPTGLRPHCRSTCSNLSFSCPLVYLGAQAWLYAGCISRCHDPADP